MCQTTRLAVPPLCAPSFSFLYHVSSFDSVNLWNDHPPFFVLWAEISHFTWEHLCLARVWEPCRLVSSPDKVWSDAWVVREDCLFFHTTGLHIDPGTWNWATFLQFIVSLLQPSNSNTWKSFCKNRLWNLKTKIIFITTLDIL